jgi:uncharacterized repeat protein (TIGR04076 family)
MDRCRITVLKRNFEKEIAEIFLKEEDLLHFDKCDLLKEGDVFICDHPFYKPEGFPCDGAWADIKNTIIAVSAGMDIPWLKERNMSIVSCGDALRPVIFKIEKI